MSDVLKAAIENNRATRLYLYGGVELVVPFQRETAKTYWSQALERGDRFINFNEWWVCTDSIYAVTAAQLEAKNAIRKRLREYAKEVQ